MKFNFVPAAITAALFTFTLPQMAQEAPIKTAADVAGPTQAPTPQHIIAADLPQAKAADVQSIREVPRPRNPHFTDAQWNALKAQAAHAPAVSRRRA